MSDRPGSSRELRLPFIFVPGSSRELRLPFIFVPHGEPEPPQLAAFRARHPGWFAIPATFVPRAAQHAEANAGSEADGPGEPAAPPAAGQQRQSFHASVEPGLRAFRNAYALHGDARAALRAIRDDPEGFLYAPPSSTPTGTRPPAQARQGYVANEPEQWIGQSSVGSGQCVPLVQQATGAPLTGEWRRGIAVKGNGATIRPGTAIATFDDDGRYGNHTDGRSHAAIYLGQDATGIWVIDQWTDQNEHHLAPSRRHIRFDNNKAASDDGNRFYVVN